MHHLFPKVISYNRFVELAKKVAIPLALFIKKVLLGKYTVSLTAHPYECARTRVSIFTRRSKE